MNGPKPTLVHRAAKVSKEPSVSHAASRKNDCKGRYSDIHRTSKQAEARPINVMLGRSGASCVANE